MRAFTATLLAMLLAGCSSSIERRDDHTISHTPAQAPLTGRAALGMAIPIPGADACIVPFAVEDRKAVFAADDPFTRGGLASYASARRVVPHVNSGGAVRWHNAVIRSFGSDAPGLVLDRRGIISRYSFFGQTRDDPNSPFVAHWIAFIATTDDTNADGNLDDRDATVAIIATPDGRRIRELTPARAQVWEIARADAGGRFYFKVVPDTNADGRFDDADAATIHEWLPSSDAPAASPVVSPDELSRLESLVR